MNDRDVFRQVRFSVYFALALNAAIIQIAPFQFRCSLPGCSCFACGLRTAVNFLLRGRFSQAYRSNKLIVVVAIAAVVMAADVLSYLYRRGKARRERAKMEGVS